LKCLKSKKNANEFEFSEPFSGKKVIICGKGGSGRSSIVALMAKVLHSRGYDGKRKGLYCFE
jgi:ABC-type transport system involved in cytochrome bd biosynthesis fused ATPase/permease subunit